jgi:hypothetical protein
VPALYVPACERLFILSQYACLVATSNQHWQEDIGRETHCGRIRAKKEVQSDRMLFSYNYIQIYIHTQILTYIRMCIHAYVHSYDLGIEKSCMCTGTPIIGAAPRSVAKSPVRPCEACQSCSCLLSVLSPAQPCLSPQPGTHTHGHRKTAVNLIVMRQRRGSVHTRYVCVDRFGQE